MGFDAKELHRRGMIALTAALGPGVLTLRGGLVMPAVADEKRTKEEGDEKGWEDVSAAEDLMREHDVIASRDSAKGEVDSRDDRSRSH